MLLPRSIRRILPLTQTPSQPATKLKGTIHTYLQATTLPQTALNLNAQQGTTHSL